MDHTPGGAAFTEMLLEVFRVNRVLLDAGDELTAGTGLTSARWQVLGVLEHGPAPVANAARLMGLTRQSVRETAEGLERDEMIEFRENPHHRRARLMVLTPAGRKALALVTRRQVKWANGIARSQDAKALRAAAAQLRNVRQTVEKKSKGEAS